MRVRIRSDSDSEPDPSPSGTGQGAAWSEQCRSGDLRKGPPGHSRRRSQTTKPRTAGARNERSESVHRTARSARAWTPLPRATHDWQPHDVSRENGRRPKLLDVLQATTVGLDQTSSSVCDGDRGVCLRRRAGVCLRRRLLNGARVAKTIAMWQWTTNTDDDDR